MNQTIIPPTMNPPTMILTRNLYNKNDIFIVLLVSILEKDNERALFWAFELYFSGFEIEVFEFLLKVYKSYFEKYNPKFKRFILSKYSQWRSNKEYMTLIEKERILSCILLNLTYRSYREIKTESFVIVPIHSHQFFIKIDPSLKPYQILKNNCIFGINDNNWFSDHLSYIKNTDLIKEYITIEKETDYINHLFYHWEYFAYFSTYCKNIIQKYKGFQNHSLKKVEFLNHMYEDEFYEKYNLEPDEQSRETIIKLIG